MILSQRKADMVDRVTWTPLPEGKVQQEWEQSVDGGKNWKSAFLGFYERTR
jgi:hypothetical protein